MSDSKDDGQGTNPSVEGELALPDADERQSVEALARALEHAADPAPGSAAATVHALRAGRGQAAPLDPARKAAIVARAMASARVARRRRVVRTVAVGFAAAAAVLLGLGTWGLRGEGAPAASVAYGGASDDVFGAPFADDQRASERLDVLTSARARDYFSALGAGGGDR